MFSFHSLRWEIGDKTMMCVAGSAICSIRYIGICKREIIYESSESMENVYYYNNNMYACMCDVQCVSHQLAQMVIVHEHTQTHRITFASHSIGHSLLFSCSFSVVFVKSLCRYRCTRVCVCVWTAAYNSVKYLLCAMHHNKTTIIIIDSWATYATCRR